MNAIPNNTDLGRAIRRLRHVRGLSIEALAFGADIHPTYLSQIERGRGNPSWNVLAKLACAIGLPVSALATDAEAAHGLAERVQEAGVHPYDFAVLAGRRAA